jgi:KDO2-lipid IV(A) lauroyltransferase
MLMKKQRIRNFLTTGGAWSFEIGAAIVDLLPTLFRRPFVSALGLIFGALAQNMNAALDDNLERLLLISYNERRKLKNKIFSNFALTLLDFFFPENVTIDVPDREKLEAIRKTHGGVLVLTFHMGHWELGARTMQKWGWPVSAVYQPYRNKRFKKVIERRRAPGVQYIPVGGKAANGVLQALQDGRIVAMLGDHPFGEAGTPVNLFGKKVLWPKGPIVLATRENTPIVIAVIVRTAPHHYTAFIEDPLIPQSKSKSEVDRLVQAVADKFGKFVTQFPDQWYRFRKFKYVE